jgi:hypothetical protein
MQAADRSRATRPRFLPRTLAATRSCLPDGCADVALSPGDALRRGRLVHLLLEHLPNVPPPGLAQRRAPDRRAGGPDVSDEELAEVYTRSRTGPDRAASRPCLRAPTRWPRWRSMATAPFWGGAVLGAIDRLIVENPRPCRRFQDQYRCSRPARGCARGSVAPDGRLCRDAARDLPRPGVATAILWSRTATADGTARGRWWLSALPRGVVIRAS